MDNFITVTFNNQKVQTIKSFDELPVEIFDDVIIIDCENMNLKSIPFFPNLIKLFCSENQIVEIHPYPKLEILICYKNQIEELPVFPELKELNCSYNPIFKLSIKSHNLIYLTFKETNISMIDSDNLDSLNVLRCDNSKLTYIPSMKNVKIISCMNCKIDKFVGDFPNLIELECTNNDINIFTANMPQIMYINCSNNQILDIPLYDSLKDLNCDNNKIKTIKSYPNLYYLHINYNNLTEFTGYFPNLDYLYCMNNQIDIFTANLPNLSSLNCSHNFISSIPSFHKILSIYCEHNLINRLGEYPSLINLFCNDNQIEEISHYSNIMRLYCKNNRIREIPNLTSLHILCCGNNLLTTLPNINTWRNLSDIYYEGNMINYLPVHIQMTINRLKNQNNGIYNDHQNIHDTSIQKSIQKSIDLIIRDPPTVDLLTALSEIDSESGLSDQAKNLIKISCDENEKLTVCDILYRELFVNVWSIIREHHERKEIISVMNQEMIDSIDKCFVGKISRLINCLNGFDSRVVIEIDIKDQIANIIIMIQIKLGNDNEYTVEKHRQLVIEALRERNIDEDVIQMWISYIESS